jgi:SNF2 family DNA or RNA helicase
MLQMGLGKTVEILGCITVNFPPFRMGNRSKHGRTTTLIVVPKSAVLQWEAEVQRHCRDLKVGLYEKDSEMEPEETLSNDILLVTYDQLLTAERMAGQKKKKQRGKPRISLLFKSEFFRVCLDEAHKIKNRESATFRVCCKLQAKHRWCATGTPTPNGIAELYSYLKFINHPLVKDFPTFRDQYLGGKKGKLFQKGVENKYEQLHRLLEQVMIMRTPGHKLLGGALVELPETHFVAISVPLSTEETVIYKYVEKHIGDHIIKKSGKKPKPKNLPTRPRKKQQGDSSISPDDEGLGFKSLCEVALRLRQLVASPLLLEQVVKDGIWTTEQVRQMKDEALKRGCSRTPFIDQFETWISEPEISQTASRKANRLEQKRNKLNSSCCPVCNKPRLQEPHKSQCGCVCCKGCIDFRIEFCKKKEMDIHCVRCNMPIGTPIPCGLPGEPSFVSGEPATERSRMRGEDFLRFQPKEDFGSNLFQNLDANTGAEIPLSSKMQAILERIHTWQADAPQDKIILFFQFIGSQRILGRALQDHGIEFIYFVGEMDYQQREVAKECFGTNPEIKVLASIYHHSVFQYAPSNQNFR